MDQPARFRTADDFARCTPVHAVWEITLACDLKCRHCGSRAGRKRPSELTTEECYEVIDALARLGTREVNLIGGEAYLRPDWTHLVRRIRARGMKCLIQTGGRHFTKACVDAAMDAGLDGLGVSLDGMLALHDWLRGVSGSFEAALQTLRLAREAGLSTSVNTQIGARTARDLPALLEVLQSVGATHWQLQLTVAMGNAADNQELLLQPYELLDLMPLLAALYKEAASRGIVVVMGNNIGYFGPYESLWRGFGDDAVHWTGCSAGQTAIALESDGLVKGCPSLESNRFGSGNVRDLSLDDIWRTSERLRAGRARSTDALWGFCRTCYYAEACLGGCTWTSQSLFGEGGNNPYCHHRVLELHKRGLRERVVKVAEAPQRSFAIGKFELVVEPIDPDGAEPPPEREATGAPAGPPAHASATEAAPRVPIRLTLCRACHLYVFAHEQQCPHCGEDIAAARANWESTRTEAWAAVLRLEDALRALEPHAPPPAAPPDRLIQINGRTTT